MTTRSLAFAALLAACAEGGPAMPHADDSQPPEGISISNSVEGTLAVARQQASGGVNASEAAEITVVYVSASPGTFPDGVAATATNLATGGSVTTDVKDGGFDPIVIAATAGDEIEIVVQQQDGTSVAFSLFVPRRTPPGVVRTRPPNGDTDIVLNHKPAVVFSEPVDSNTVTRETVKLLLDGERVEGSLVFSADGLRAEFTPAAPLTPETTYTLVITTGVRDRDGDPLEEEVVVSFTTEHRPAAQLAFGVQPRVTHGNQAMAPAVQVAILDEFGNTVTSATEPVTLALGTNPHGGTLSGTTTVSAVGGIATFDDLSIDRPGSGYTLEARSGILRRHTSSAFDIILSFASVSTGGVFTCGLTTTGDAYCWGGNFNGQLGDGTTTGSLTPALVAGGLSFTSMSSGLGHTCGVVTTGDVYCWGENFEGQLGNGTATLSLTPVPLSGGLRFATVSAGKSTCGVTTAGAAYCWGENFNGQLGDGTTESSLTPVPVSGGLSFAAISGGGGSTCGVATTGDAYCWGANSSGRLGDGTTESSLTPVRVSGGLRFAAISSGGWSTCGVTTTGEGYCWGNNSSGMLGDGTTIRSLTPVPVSGGLRFAAISGAGWRTCGVTTSGDAYCWGDNNGGQLGDGTTNSSLTPVPVSGGLRFAMVSPAGLQTCGVTATGEAYCWGSNPDGQFGGGTTSGSLTPVRVVQ